ncbi:STAS domain-containing protein [Sphaerisporangium dianthi]|uniref:STAS domain-containing protein n=1 Tax=Sphaerisporangium dianthi TaxID=1436120 RepID=A0ABV9CSI2_9ACTN
MNTDDTAGTPHDTDDEPATGAVTGSGERLRITRCLAPRGLRIAGDLDHTSTPVLSEALASMAGGGSVFVDLTGLAFIDVGGLRAIVMAAGRMEGDHVLELCSASTRVRRLLEVTGWHDAPHLGLNAQSCLFRTRN